MAEAGAAGIPPTEFWHLTYRELFNALKGEHLRRRRDRQQIVFGAWHGESFARHKRLPNLTDILRKMEPSRVMSPREQRAAIMGIAEAMGATVTYKRRVDT